MKKLVLSVLLVSFVMSCSSQVEILQHGCQKDPTIDFCPPLDVLPADIRTIQISKSDNPVIVSVLTRHFSKLCVDHNYSDCVTDQVSAKIKQPTSSTEVDVPQDRIKLDLVIIKDQNNKDYGTSTVDFHLLQSDLQSLVPGAPAVLEIALIDWQGVVKISSYPLIVSP